jgi:hypothetical protein
MREFNTFGPVDPTIHYHVNRVDVKADLRQRIEKGRYLTFSAARQTGKTTLFREVLAELEATGEYVGILLNFEGLNDLTIKDFYEELGQLLEKWRKENQPTAPAVGAMRHHVHFVRWLQTAAQTLGKRCLLIIDEFDALAIKIIKPILSQLRAVYLARKQGEALGHDLQSVILVGVRNLPSLLEGTQSPFNIADQFTVPYFSPDEIKTLLAQHTQECGQPFAPTVIDAIISQSEGQPFLVNRLAQMLTRELATEVTQPILMSHLNLALARLVNENNTHFASITSKALPHRRMLLPMLFYDQMQPNLRESVTADLLMYGVLRTVENESGLLVARIANPIYRKVLILTFAPPLEETPDLRSVRYQRLVNGVLHFDELLDQFREFMTEHGVRLLKSDKTRRPLEISGQYLLLSYLSAIFTGIEGYVAIEAVNRAGEMDIVAFYRGQRFVIETKIWYGEARFAEGKAQLVRYLQAAGLSKGYLVVFDEALDKNPVLAQVGAVFEVMVEGKTLRIYLIGISV